MKIENHRLVGDELTTVSQLPVVIGPTIAPEVIVIHYGVTERLDSLVSAQRVSGYWAHLSIDGADSVGRQVVQALPFNSRGSHAGKSIWRGKQAVNGFSVGIEICNPGPLIEGHDGILRTTYGSTWPRIDALKARHKAKFSPITWNYWALYSEAEMEMCLEICKLLREAYPTIVDVVGHDDISPGRKFDPGPAFPMDWLRSEVFE